MMIIAKNDEGRQDLNYILSVANEDGFMGSHALISNYC